MVRDNTSILAMNINGYPSNKANKYKLLELNRLAVMNDVTIMLETGVNKNCNPKRISDDHQLARINY